MATARRGRKVGAAGARRRRLSRKRAALDAAGIKVDDIALRRPTLDDVFLALTGRATEEERPQRCPSRREGRMSSLAMSMSDTLVLAKRNLIRIPRQPDLLIAYTIQPVMFVLLFVYVFGGAIDSGPFDYVDFLMPGIIVQSIAFGGFVTALGLSDDVRKGLIDRFRSLPMSRAAVLAGRTFSDIPLNCLSLVVLLAVGFAAGFGFIESSVGQVVLGIVLLLLIGYAFSWIFALLGLLSSTPETANSIGFVFLFRSRSPRRCSCRRPRCPTACGSSPRPTRSPPLRMRSARSGSARRRTLTCGCPSSGASR